MPRDIDAVVLAGGLGTRLRGVLPDGCPKILAPVEGSPFIDLQLRRLYDEGIRHAVLSLGHGADLVVQHLLKHHFPAELTVSYVIESEPLGTGGALRFAYEKTVSDPFLALNGDTYCNADLDRLVAYHRDRQAAITLALARVTDGSRYGQVQCASDGAVTAFVEKNPRVGAGLINCGVYVISRTTMAQLPHSQRFSWEQDVLARRIGNGVYGVEAADRFIDIGTPQSLSAAPGYLSQGETKP